MSSNALFIPVKVTHWMGRTPSEASGFIRYVNYRNLLSMAKGAPGLMAVHFEDYRYGEKILMEGVTEMKYVEHLLPED
jgi:hypothetical protein